MPLLCFGISLVFFGESCFEKSANAEANQEIRQQAALQQTHGKDIGNGPAIVSIGGLLVRSG
jgi:hypothetical protein